MDLSTDLQERVQAAHGAGRPLRVVGGGSKAFYGRPIQAERSLSVQGHSGVIEYQPAELFITARAGTPLTVLHETLAERGQALACEVPAFGPGATLGGALACGFSGPARPYLGSLRDQVLGMRILNGKGEDLRFGGRVMKNVAGYDLSRLMVGALGTLGVILEATLKVLPMPAHTLTLVQECSRSTAIQRMNRWAAKPLPLTGSAHLDGRLYFRLTGAQRAVAAAQTEMGGEVLGPDAADRFWADLREQRLDFFAPAEPLWRFAVAPASPVFCPDLPQVLEWGGGLRWLRAAGDRHRFQELARTYGGHALLFRSRGMESPFPLLPAPLMDLHRQLKAAFDPRHILNPGHLYPDL
ncbi:glycolate oxidase subunit GlcE [Acidithiobacillus sp. M4-SHS-6]|uniref:glycolate oxidase subunit GlcE n=1 Tax=Acidithiobacillus sp. M4-SHS-6 TaxID=3383024 RepID=UPI0039BE7827